MRGRVRVRCLVAEVKYVRECSVRFDLDNARQTRSCHPPSPVIYPKSICLSQTLLTAMPPRGGNAKKESGRAKKAANEAKKQEAVVADKVCTSFSSGNRTGGMRAHVSTGTPGGIQVGSRC